MGYSISFSVALHLYESRIRGLAIYIPNGYFVYTTNPSMLSKSGHERIMCPSSACLFKDPPGSIESMYYL